MSYVLGPHLHCRPSLSRPSPFVRSGRRGTAPALLSVCDARHQFQTATRGTGACWEVWSRSRRGVLRGGVGLAWVSSWMGMVLEYPIESCTSKMLLDSRLVTVHYLLRLHSIVHNLCAKWWRAAHAAHEMIAKPAPSPVHLSVSGQSSFMFHVELTSGCRSVD